MKKVTKKILIGTLAAIAFLVPFTYIHATVLALVLPIIIALKEAALAVSCALWALAASVGVHLRTIRVIPITQSIVGQATPQQMETLFKSIFKKAGYTISPEFFVELNQAGRVGDFPQIARLLNQIKDPQGIPIAHKLAPIAQAASSAVRPQGMQYFAATKTYAAASVQQSSVTLSAALIHDISSNLATTVTQQFKIQPKIAPTLATNAQNLANDATTIPIPTVLDYGAERMQQEAAAALLMHQRSANLVQQAHQSIQALDAQAHQEACAALQEVMSHLTDTALRAQLLQTIDTYEKTLARALSTTASPQVAWEQLRIATQGLPLPGFLNDFSDAFQKRFAVLVCENNGAWKGLTDPNAVSKAHEASRYYRQTLTTLGQQVTSSPDKAADGLYSLYWQKVGAPTVFEKLKTSLANAFGEDQLPYEQLRANIISSPYNNELCNVIQSLGTSNFDQANKAIENLRIVPLNASRAMVNDQLLGMYKQSVAHFAEQHSLAAYAQDPFYTLYKPIASTCSLQDQRLFLIESHLKIRDGIYRGIVDAIGGNKFLPSSAQKICYELVDKITDPIACIDTLNRLSADAHNPAFKEAYPYFFTEQGITRLFGSAQTAYANYNIAIPATINLEKNAALRTALNKALLLDTSTSNPQVQASVRHAIQYIQYACQDDQYAQYYRSLALDIVQAYTVPSVPSGITTIDFIAHPLRNAAAIGLESELLPPAAKAAYEDLYTVSMRHATAIKKLENHINKVDTLTPDQVWPLIAQAQHHERLGNTAQVRKIVSLLKEYADGKKQPFSLTTQTFIASTIAQALNQHEKASTPVAPGSSDQPPSSSPDPPKDDKEKEQSEIKISENDASHMFGNRDGHFPDTPENRKLLTELVADAKNYLGPDKRGNTWYAKMLPSGKQLWASVKDGLIRNGGLNDIPRTYNKETGLSRILPPQGKMEKICETQ